jgi:monofunctional biosynthetic peptidoglycan transglycosylase
MSKGSMLARPLRLLARLVALLLLLSIVAVAALRWLDPPGSAFMIQHGIAARLSDSAAAWPRHEWVDWEAISPALKLAVMAAEDQRFPDHRGFDLIEVRAAWQRFRQGGALRGASTITQQTAKNLFLWGGRDYARKLLEAWFSLLLETLLSKERILELYLNIAQFGPDTFGVGASSWRYFDRPAIAIDPAQAALMAAVLPNPRIYRLDDPSRQVRRRASWIRQQMRQLGGNKYLQKLAP